MKTFLLPALFVTSLVLLGACAPLPKEDPRAPRFGHGATDASGTQIQQLPPPPTPTPQPAYAPEPDLTPAPAPTPTPTPEIRNYPYGVPVPDKPGFVTSPHAPYSGYVDVRGFPSGTEVKDPFTGKIFLVP